MAKEFSGSVVGIDIGGEENLPLDPEIIRVYQVNTFSKLFIFLYKFFLSGLVQMFECLK